MKTSFSSHRTHTNLSGRIPIVCRVSLLWATWMLVIASTQTLRAETRVNLVDGSIRPVTLSQSTAPWNPQGSPYLIEADFSIGAGVPLQILPGTVVRIAPGAGIFVSGRLLCTNATFTVLGEGNWRGIYISPESTGSVLHGSSVQFAGRDNLGFFRGGWRRTAIYLDSTDATVTQCRIQGSAGHGIEVYGGKVVLQQNVFEQLPVDWYSIVCDTMVPLPRMSANTNLSTGTLGVWVPGGEQAVDQTWDNAGEGLAYFVAEDFTLKAGATLSLGPGVRIRSQSRAFWFEGTLRAVGTQDHPVLFDGAPAQPSPGDWRGIYFGPTSSNSVLVYVNILNAGRENLGYLRQAWRATSVFIDGASPRFENVRVAGSFWHGIESYGSDFQLVQSVIENCGGRAIVCQAGGHPMLTDVRIVNSGSASKGFYPVWSDAGSVPDPVRVSLNSNRLSGVEVGGGLIPASIQWKKWADNVPYVVSADLTIAEGAVWRIEPGTVLKFIQCGVYVNGVLKAESSSGAGGTAFTSWRDDSLGGDSNGDASATVPEAGNWRGIYLSPNSGSSVFSGCTLAYSGQENLGFFRSYWRRTTLFVDDCDPLIENCKIVFSAGHGLDLYSSASVIKGNQFQSVAENYYAVVWSTLDQFPSLGGNTFGGSGHGGIALPGGTVLGTNVWRNPGPSMVYYLNDEISIDPTARVEIEAGTRFLTANQRLMVHGTLLCNGTQGAPVSFASRRVPSAPGDWRGIYFGPNASGSRMSHVNIEDAGQENLGYFQSAWRATSIFVESSKPVFDNVSVSRSFWHGVQLHAASPVFTNLAVADCGGSALIALEGSRPAIQGGRMSGNGFRGGGSFVVVTDARSVPVPGGIQFGGNSYQGVAVDGGTLDLSATWKVWGSDVPYVITRDVGIATGVTLEMEPGLVTKFNGTGLYVSGQLIARGNELPIAFTSYRDDALAGDTNNNGATNAPAPGQWKGIYLSPDSGASVIHNSTIKYSGLENLGYFKGGWRRTALFADECSPTITSCRFLENGSHGVELYSSSAILQGNRFENHPDWGYPVVFSTLDCFPRIASNEVAGTGKGGIYVPPGTLTRSGDWMNPGRDFPYLVEGSLTVGSEAVLTLHPGVVTRWTEALFVAGRLEARGNESLRIQFLGRLAATVPGEWRGIYFGPGTGQSVLAHCDIAGAGQQNLGFFNGAWRATSVYIDSSNPGLSNVRITRSATTGLMIYSGAPSISSSLLVSNEGSAVVSFGTAAPVLVNNTVALNGGGGVELVEGSGRAINNIVAFNKADGFNLVRASAQLERNLVFGNVHSNYVNTVPGLGDISSDPAFVSASTGDFHLSPGSPAIDRGISSASMAGWTDYDGKLRVAGQSVDLGALESSSVPATRLVDAQIQLQGDTGFVGIGERDPVSQIRTTSVLPGKTAVYLVKLNYSGNLVETVKVLGTTVPDGWQVRAFDSTVAGADVTSQLLAATGFSISNLTNGSSRVLRFEVTPGSEVAGSTQLPLTLTAFPEGDRALIDRVTAVTTNLPVRRVDLSIRREEDIRSTGAGVIWGAGEAQTRTAMIDAARPVRFILAIKNAGNVAESFVFRGPGASAPWSISYSEPARPEIDLSSSITGPGLRTESLNKGSTLELAAVVGLSGETAETAKAFEFSAFPVTDGSSLDVVRALLRPVKNNGAAQSAIYTASDDFDLGVLVGVEATTVRDQLQLTSEPVTLPFLWVPNSNEGTVSKVDTRTGRELARYRTGPQSTGSPSRTTVDQAGNCWVANRVTGTAVKIALVEAGQAVDRDGNGRIDTSTDLNGDGNITGEELLPWGREEAVLYEVVLIAGKEGTHIPGAYAGGYANDNWNPGPRGIAVDSRGDVWIGSYGTKKFHLVSGSTGAILKTIDVSPVNHTSYGAVIDAQGILWSSGQDKRHVLRLNTVDGGFGVLDIGHYVYGLGLDRSNHLFVSGWTDAKLSRVDVISGKKDWTVEGVQQSRGIAVTADGDVWTANSGPGTVTRWSPEGVVKQTYVVGSAPTGVAVASDGRVWVVNDGEENIRRIDPANRTVDLVKRIVGGTHYGYSDMTGILARNVTTQLGTWTVIHNSGFDDSVWKTLQWHSDEPAGTRIGIRVRSSKDRLVWSGWESPKNGGTLVATPQGRFLQIEATFQVLSGTAAPVLKDLSVEAGGGVVPPEPALLTIQWQPQGQCIVSWQHQAVQWVLETSDHVSGGIWTAVQNTPEIRDGRMELVVPASGAQRFFRLRSP